MDEVVLQPGMTWEPNPHMSYVGRVRADDTKLKAAQARAKALERQLRWVKGALRNYHAAMVEEDLEDESAWRRELFDWAGI